ncbi:hypothetical protein PanWU01x14_234750 [Parasponia andersonii]|uniref:Uncharacterized protein n=1 Tax=Parasponia andersonii TaxID=3476 RepID=A0A2P5BJ03_PARAD|nr:hypothetical protein PanWU01x14_234750 [Parasponia andersonii]
MKQERERRTKRRKVNTRVTGSQDPLLVKTGVRSWKARRVPVGSRLAKLAVVVRVCEMARWERLCRRCGGPAGVFDVSAGSGSVVDGCLVGAGLGLRDMMFVYAI